MASSIAGQNTTGGNYHVVITTGAGTATVTITKQGGGTFTEAETETLIKAIQYWHSDPNNPTDGDRLIDVTVNDGTADSAAARTTINVNPVISGPNNRTFQQDSGGYTGTVDTYVQSNLPNTDNSASPDLFADGTLVAQQLIRFDNIFGVGLNQIPLGATITSATLTFYVTNETNGTATVGLHRMLSAWSDTDTWNSMTNGIDTEAAGTADHTLAIPHGFGFKTFSGAGLVSTLQDWSDGQTNHGWAVFNNHMDALGFGSAEQPTVTLRPILSVEFAANNPPTLDLDVNDSSGATGNDYQFTFTEGDGPTAIADTDTDLVDVDSTTFDHVTLSVSGLLDGNAEVLELDSDTFALATAVGGQDTTGGNYHVVITTGAGTATVTITKQGGGLFNETGTETLIKAIQYQHTDTNAPTDGDRLIDVTVNDGTDDSAAARTTINVNPVNDQPVNTVPGAQVVAEDTVLNISGLSVNDVDGNLSTVQLTVTQGTVTVTLSGGATISAGVNGSNTLTLSGTQADINATLASLSYQGNLNYNGPDTLTVTSTDGNSATDVDVVGITVTAVNDAPVNTVPGTQTVVEETQTAIAGLSVADVDAGAGLITTQLQVSNGVLDVTLSGAATISAGANGSADLTIQGTVADINGTLASLLYTGNTDVTGIAADTLMMTTDDGGNTGSGGAQQDADNIQIDITNVNDAPVNTVPGAQVVAEDTALNISGLSVNDVDGNLSTVQLTVTQGTVTVTLSGGATISAGANGTNTLTLSGTQADINATLASLSYQGNLNYNGPDTLTVTSTDSNSATDVDVVGITVNAANDAPVNTVPGAQVVAVDTPLNIMGLSVNDVDGNLSTVQLTVTQGTVTVTLSGGATISAGTNGTSTLTLSGTETDINATLASLIYQGNLSYSGPDTLTVTSTDGNSATDVDGVGITVNVTNTAPVNTVPGAQVVAEDTPLNIMGLSVNDVDGNLSTVQLAVTQGTVTVTLSGGATISAGANGSSTLTLSGTQADINATLASLSYQGNLNYNGPDTLTVTSTDGNSATDVDMVGITVTPVNDAPVNTVPATATVAENTALAMTGPNLISVTDVDGNLATTQLTVVNGTVTVTLSGAATISAGANGTSTLTISGTETDINATLASLIYQGTLNYNGPDTLTTLSTDSAGTPLSDIDVTNITVTSVNEAPVNTVPGAQVVAEDTALNISGLSVNDVDGNLSTVQLTVTQGMVTVTLSGGATISAGANGTNTLTISGTETDINATLASLIYQGSFNYTGPDTLTVTSTDGNSATDVDVVGITVTADNDAPVAVADSFTVNEGSTNTLDLAGNDTDADDGLDLTSITIISGPTNGTIDSINAGGTVTYTHNGSETLADSFTYTIDDLTGATSNTVTVSLNVTPQNDAPIITSNGGGASAAVTVIEGNTVVTGVNASDAEGTSLTYSIVGGADATLFSIDSSTGVLTFNTAPDSQAPNDVGGDNIYNVIVQASDGTASDTQAIAVTVTTTPPVVIPPPPPDPAPDPPPDDGDGDTEGSEEEASGGGLGVGGTSPGGGSSGSSSLPADDPNKGKDMTTSLTENNLAALQLFGKGQDTVGGVSELLALLQQPFDTIAFKSEIQSLLSTSGFLHDLDRVRDAFQDVTASEKTYMASSIAASTGLSIGYVFWLLRSGVLLTALLSSVPAWQFVNPLLVLDTPEKRKRKKGQEDQGDDSVETMFEKHTVPNEVSETKTGKSHMSRWTRRTSL